MAEQLRVLIIEDSEDDAILAVHRLTKAGYQVEHRIVDDEPGVRDALESGHWDIVLSDYTLPLLDARHALQIVQEANPGLPFVVVSGTIGDERATELMRLGASDYVLKDHAQRFAPVVKRSLGDARERALLEGAQQALVVAGQEWIETFEAIADGVLVLDPWGRVERANRAAIELLGKTRAEVKGRDGLKLIGEACGPDLALDDWLSETRVALEWGPCDRSGLWYEITSDPVLDVDGECVGHVVVISDITARKASEAELHALVGRLERVMRGTVTMAARMVESRDPYTAGHQERVAEFAVDIAQRMGMSAEDVETIRTAALMHDIGKIGVPAEILVKPGELTEVEWELVRVHPVAGADILAEVEFDKPIAEIVRQHHERLDGSGYPDGLTGDQIRVEAKVLAVADVAEAMLAHRPYRPACTVEMTRSVLEQGRGVCFDEAAVDAMLDRLSEPEDLRAVSGVHPAGVA